MGGAPAPDPIFLRVVPVTSAVYFKIFLWFHFFFFGFLYNPVLKKWMN